MRRATRLIDAPDDQWIQQGETAAWILLGVGRQAAVVGAPKGRLAAGGFEARYFDTHDWRHPKADMYRLSEQLWSS
ncbi:MAG: hypothetical protein WCD11_34885 [Solirubrobacteraceae bacterium]